MTAAPQSTQPMTERPQMHDWGDACEYMEKLEERCAAYKGQVKAGSDEIAALRAKADELTAALRWQPIETAPKDGTVIEVIDMDADDPQPFPAHWAQNDGWGDEPAWLIGWPEMWAAGRSAWRATMGDKRNAASCLGIITSPTHWQRRCSVNSQHQSTPGEK